MRFMKWLAPLALAAGLVSGSHAQTYTKANIGLNKASSPYTIAVDIGGTATNFQAIGTITAAGVFVPSHLPTFSCASHTWLSASTSLGAATCTQPAVADLSDTKTGSGNLVLATSPTLTGATLTGGSLNNAPVGQSTPAAGAFTTFSATSGTFSTPLPVASGGTGSASPTLTGGSGITVSGSWPGQTITYSGAGGWTLINTLTATAGVTTSLTDTTSLTGAYSEYEIVLEDFQGTTTTAYCIMQVYSSAAYQTASYISNYNGTGVTTGAPAPTGGLLCGNTATVTMVSPYGRSRIVIVNPSVAGRRSVRMYNGMVAAPTGTVNEYGSGWWNGGTTAITGFRIFPATSLTTPTPSITFGQATVVKIYGRN